MSNYVEQEQTVRHLEAVAPVINECLRALDNARELLAGNEDHQAAIKQYRIKAKDIYLKVLQKDAVKGFVFPSCPPDRCSFRWVDLYHRPARAGQLDGWTCELVGWAPGAEPTASEKLIHRIVEWYARCGHSLTEDIFCGREKRTVDLKISPTKGELGSFVCPPGITSWPADPQDEAIASAYGSFRTALRSDRSAGRQNRVSTKQLARRLGITDTEIDEWMRKYLYLTSLWEQGVLESGQSVYYYYMPVSVPGTKFFNTGTLLALAGAQQPDEHAVEVLALVLTRWGYHVHYVEALHQVLTAAQKTAGAAIMTRNMSHNIGSHSLANSNLLDELGLPAPARPEVSEGGQAASRRQKVSSYLQYLQGRQNFTAQAMDPLPPVAEPMLFWGDMLRPFLEQSSLLNTLISDLRWTRNNMAFNITVGPSNVRVDWNSLAAAGLDDCLVGIPGGTTGCHALYSVLENVLRNAAKYGSQRATTSELRIDIRLWPEPGRYVCEVRDSLGSPQDIDAVMLIRRHLNRVIVNGEGSPQAKGHGIQEMKACAAFLAPRNATWFPKDDEFLCGEEPHVCGYSRFLSNMGSVLRGASNEDGCGRTEETHAWMRSALPLRCYLDATTHSGGIVYQFVLQKPCLLAVLPITDKGVSVPPPLPYIHVATDLDDLARCAPAIGVVLQANTRSRPAMRAEFARLRSYLPLRLFIARKTGPAKAKIVDGIHSVKADASLWDDLQKLCAGRRMVSENIIIKAYDAWVGALKQPPNDQKWTVCIGVLHDEKQTALSRWKPQVDAFQADNVAVQLVAETEKTPFLPASSKKAPGATILAYDRHGICIEREDKTAAEFAMDFAGGDYLSMIHRLQSPPKGSLPFGWFVLALAETALLRVAILDERFVEAMKEPKSIRIDKIQHLARMGLFGLFRIRLPTEQSYRSVRDASSEKTDLDNLKYFGSRKLNEVLSTLGEGLDLKRRVTTALTGSYSEDKRNEASKKERQLCNDFHVLLVHVGLIERLRDAKVWAALKTMPIRIALTSGGGQGSTRIPVGYPFVEVSRLSMGSFPNVDKYALSQALMAARASFCRDEA